MLIFFKWVCAHLLGDFVFQSRTMVAHKRQYQARSGYLYLHAAIHGALLYLFTGWWINWQIPLVVGVTHFLIDWWKLNRKDTLFYFIVDQLLHLVVIASLWAWFLPADRATFLTAFRELLARPSFWITGSAYIVVIWPSSFVLGYLTRRWREAIETRKGESGRIDQAPSLSEAGKWIGILERVLVLTFVLTNHFEGIGFLIAAKSILRFGEIKGGDYRPETEYILIGTLMSFSASILTGLLCRYLLFN